VDFVAKPGVSGRTLDEYRADVIEKVRTAAYARVRKYGGAQHPEAVPAAIPGIPGTAAGGTAARGAASGGACADGSASRDRAVAIDLIAMGASTGGVSALQQVLQELPSSIPPVVITQHIPAGFSRAFAERLDAQLALQVHEAQEAMTLEAGHVYIAPGGQQFSIERHADGYRCRVHRAPPVNFHRPSVEVLFRSVARHAGARAIGVMLTGMGADGAQAMLEMRQAGSYNLVQDEASSVVWGMPGAAVRLGAANEVLSLERLAPVLCQLLDGARGATRLQHVR
jgi:two-component system chemotaxis response regulator CheB